jgi:hypothetical protein
MEELIILKTIKEISKKPFWREKFLVFILVFAFLINLFLWFFTFLNYKNLKETTVIHYSVLTGIDRIDKKIYLFEMPFFGTIFFIINFILINFFSERKLLVYFLTVFSLLINVFLATAIILILTL